MFTAPLFLIAALIGASVPLFLHVMQSKKKMTLQFPTLRFLQMADKKSSSRARMEYLLLWLIRTLIMVLLGLAFAMPTLNLSNMSWLGDAPRDIAVVIDTSYSMGYLKGSQSAFEQAKSAAVALLEGLGEKDRYCIYLAGEQPLPLIAEPRNDIEEGLAQLKALELGYASSHLAPALQVAYDALQLEGPSRQQEIFILTDNQALPWQSFVGATAKSEEGSSDDAGVSVGTWNPEGINPSTSIYVLRLGVDAPENVGMADVTLNPPVLFTGTSSRLSAELIRSGPPSPTTLVLSIDGQEMGRRSFLAGSAEGGAPVFPIPPLEPGIHTGLLDTPEDNLVADNKFHFLIQVKERLQALCIGSKEDTLFVRAALKAGEQSGIETTWSESDALGDKPLHTYSAVFLCNALPLSSQTLTALEGYVQAGGLLAIFPGNQALPQDYQAMSWLPAQPSGIEDFPSNQRKRTLGWSQPHHALVAPLRSGSATPTMTLRRRLIWNEWSEETRPLISMGEDEPFILDRLHGRGHVLISSISADRVWGELPLSSFFLPIIHQIVEYGAGIGGYPTFVWSERSLPLATILPEAGRSTQVSGPDGRSVAIRSTILEGRTLLQLEDAMLPGIYSLTQPGASTATPGLAVNMPRVESDLTALPIERVKELLPVKTLHVAEDQKELLQLVQDLRIGRTYGEHLLWLALVLVIVEFFYANRLSRGRSALSSLLNVAASGKVEGAAG